MIFHENRLLAYDQVLMNIIPYFCRKLGNMSQNVSSAAVVIGALRVNIFYVSSYQKCYIDTSLQRLTPKAKIE